MTDTAKPDGTSRQNSVWPRSHRVGRPVAPIADDVRRTELMVDRARRNADGWAPENVRDAEQQIDRLGDRLSELKSKGPESFPAKALELLTFAGMIVSIFGNGLFIYRKATN